MVKSGCTMRVAVATAALLLLIIVVDLGEAYCDPLPTPSGPLTMTGAQEEGSEACRNGCMPDCFCCSRPLPAANAFSFDDPRLIGANIFVDAPRLAADFSDVVDHVPLATL